MKILIAGTSKVGLEVINILKNIEDYELILIDNSEQTISSNTDNSSIIGIVGEINDFQTYEDLDIEDIDCFLALSDSTNDNIMACNIAKYYNLHNIVILVSEIKYYYSQWNKYLLNNGYKVIEYHSHLCNNFNQAITSNNNNILGDVYNINANQDYKIITFKCTKCSEENIKALTASLSLIDAKIIGYYTNNNIIFDSSDINNEEDKYIEIIILVPANNYMQLYMILFGEFTVEANNIDYLIIEGDSYDSIIHLSNYLSKNNSNLSVSVYIEDRKLADKVSSYQDWNNLNINIINQSFIFTYSNSDNIGIIYIYEDIADTVFKSLSNKNNNIKTMAYINDHKYLNITSKLENITPIIPNDSILNEIISHIFQPFISDFTILKGTLCIVTIDIAEGSFFYNKRFNVMKLPFGIQLLSLIDNENNLYLVGEYQDRIQAGNKLILLINTEVVKRLFKYL